MRRKISLFSTLLTSKSIKNTVFILSRLCYDVKFVIFKTIQYITDAYAFIMSFNSIQQEQLQQQSLSKMNKSTLTFFIATENFKFMSLNFSKFILKAKSIKNQMIVTSVFLKVISKIFVQNTNQRSKKISAIFKFSNSNFNTIVQNSTSRKTKIENINTTIFQIAKEITVVTKNSTTYYAHQIFDTVKFQNLDSMKKSTRFHEVDSFKKIAQFRENHSIKKQILSISSSIVLNVKKRSSIEKTKFFIIKISNEKNDIDKYVKLKKLMINFHKSMIRISKIRHSKTRFVIKN